MKLLVSRTPNPSDTKYVQSQSRYVHDVKVLGVPVRYRIVDSYPALEIPQFGSAILQAFMICF